MGVLMIPNGIQNDYYYNNITKILHANEVGEARQLILLRKRYVC